ncbi:MAG: hypothetical protein K8S20_12295 [Chloroflexi bacterium]|nr:hypothetical protein [Chloroflexota bacterium]
MNYLMMTLRVIHIFAGIFWVGGTLIMTFFVGPTIGATAEAGQKFAGHLMSRMKYSQRMAAAAGLTLLAGAILFWIDSDGFTSAWLSSGAGKGFSIGAGFAIIGFGTGIMIGRTIKAMGQLGAQFQGKPTPEQAAQMQALAKKQTQYTNITAAVLIFAVLFMAIARYLVF